jgi:hypothetical protein
MNSVRKVPCRLSDRRRTEGRGSRHHTDTGKAVEQNAECPGCFNGSGVGTDCTAAKTTIAAPHSSTSRTQHDEQSRPTRESRQRHCQQACPGDHHVRPQARVHGSNRQVPQCGHRRRHPRTVDDERWFARRIEQTRSAVATRTRKGRTASASRCLALGQMQQAEQAEANHKGKIERLVRELSTSTVAFHGNTTANELTTPRKLDASNPTGSDRVEVRSGPGDSTCRQRSRRLRSGLEASRSA